MFKLAEDAKRGRPIGPPVSEELRLKMVTLESKMGEMLVHQKSSLEVNSTKKKSGKVLRYF